MSARVTFISAEAVALNPLRSPSTFSRPNDAVPLAPPSEKVLVSVADWWARPAAYAAPAVRAALADDAVEPSERLRMDVGDRSEHVRDLADLQRRSPRRRSQVRALGRSAAHPPAAVALEHGLAVALADDRRAARGAYTRSGGLPLTRARVGDRGAIGDRGQHEQEGGRDQRETHLRPSSVRPTRFGRHSVGVVRRLGLRSRQVSGLANASPETTCDAWPMGMFQTLKYVQDAMKPAAIKQGLEASRAVLSGSDAGPTEEQLAALTPEQRRAYEANMAQVAQAEAEVAAAHQEFLDRELGRRALYGPAGEYVYGELPAADAMHATVEDSLATAKEQFLDVLRNPFGPPRPTPPPGALSGTGDREQQATAERAARDAARAPYLAQDRPALNITRLATRQKTQIGEVSAYLGSSGLAGRPDLVYGVYRVPDHIGGGIVLRGGSRVVEWDVVHAAPDGPAQAAPAGTAFFAAEELWALRRDGEPAVLDEDLALAYLGRAGIGPEQCLGIARSLDISQRGGGGDEGSSSYTVTQVTGVHAFHPDGLAGRAFDELRDERPLAAPPVAGVHTEVLNWHAVARAVHPETHRRHLVPSPFPHLPSTPQELLRAYLEVVGVRPDDSYSAQVTEDNARDLSGVSRKGPLTLTTNRGEEQPCADGELRPRLAGGARVVIVYRDRAEYEEGRARWATYEGDVLQAALAHGTNVRGPVHGPDFFERGTLGRVVGAAGAVHDFVEGYGDDPFAKIPPYRYCWPPAR
jgi:hypothetical protein